MAILKSANCGGDGTPSPPLCVLVMDEEKNPLERIKRRLLWSLVNLLWLLPLVYGIKCLVTLNGRCMGPGRIGYKTKLGKLHSVEGEAAVWAGLGYIAIAVFVYLYVYKKADADASWGWQLVRSPGCCASLLAFAWFWYKALHV